MPVATTLLTEADYMAIEEVEGGPRYELDEGELVEMPSARFIHNRIRGVSEYDFRDYLKRNPIGEVVSETDFRLYPNTIRRPDLMFFLNETLAGVDLEELPVPAVPELVLEVISPSESASDVERKVRQYERAGVRAIWLIYPTLRSGIVCEDGRRREIAPDGAFETALLPGFRLEMTRLFPN